MTAMVQQRLHITFLMVFKVITVLTLHGQQFTGDTCYAYLPNSPEGEECRLYIRTTEGI